MSGLVFLAFTLGAAAVALLLRPLRSAALAVTLAGLGAALVVAVGIEDGTGVAVGDVALVGTAYARTLLVLGVLAAIVTFVLARADAEPPSYAPAALAVLGAVGAALLVDDPAIGLLLVLAAGIGGVLVVLGGETPSAAAVAAATRSLRAVVVAGALTIGAAAWLARPLGVLALEPAVFGVAYLAMVGAVALRAGVIPFHLWLARLADAAPPASLPLFAVWVPVVLTVVTVQWIDRAIAPVLVPMATERLVVLAVGIASLGLGALAAWLADDAVHLALYVTVGSFGLAMVGLTVLEPEIWQPLRSWLLAFAVVQTSLFGWVAAVRAATGSRRVVDLAGALGDRRLLRLSLALVALGAIGLPGWPIWEARQRIVELALGSGPVALVEVAAFLPFVAFLRLAVVGWRGRGTAERERLGRRVVSPTAAWAATRSRWRGWRSGLGWRAAAARPSWRGPAVALRSGRLARDVAAAWRRNRVRVASAAALVLALVAVAGSAGWLGIDEAAAGGPPSLEETAPFGGGLGDGLDGEP